MLPLIWIVTNGRRGDIVQCEAIARALSDNIEEKIISPRTIYQWMMPWGPCDPIDLAQFKPPYPDLIIASGRRSVPYVRRIQKLGKGKTKALFMKYPGMNVSKFALSWHPFHDKKPGKEIIETLTAPHLINSTLLEKHRQNQDQGILDLPQPRLGVLVGGNTKSVTYTAEVVEDFCTCLEGADAFSSLAITTSRRTPDIFTQRLGNIKTHQTFLWRSPDDGPNPYVDILANCDAFVVSGDSHNLVSEALATGKQIYVFNPPDNPAKFQFTLKELNKSNKIKILPCTIETGSQTAFNATDDIVESVRQHFTFQ